MDPTSDPEPMANDIFDWDDEEEEKKSEAEVWGAYPLAQPPDVDAPEPPVQTTDLSAPTRAAEQDWQETETVMRPRPEPWQQYPPSQQAPQQDAWIDYPPGAFDRSPEQPGVWSEYKPESPDETARQGGLAWSAGIVFFSSVGFMLFLGWIADWLFVRRKVRAMFQYRHERVKGMLE